MFAQERWCASAARVVRSKRCDRPGGLVAPYAIVAADRRDAAEVGTRYQGTLICTDLH